MIFHPLDILLFSSMGISIWAVIKIYRSIIRCRNVRSYSGFSGAEIASQILERKNVRNISIRIGRGSLPNRYDPIRKVILLSEAVYLGKDVSSISIAAHTASYALQEGAIQKLILVFRHYLFPVVNAASRAAAIPFIYGIWTSNSSLIGIGIVLFSAAVAFHVAILPIELNTSEQAFHYMVQEGFIRNLEEENVQTVLDAISFNYVAAAIPRIPIYNMNLNAK
ncbi:zinc metallopeptidase [Peribacillus kribbensis]|uniref:zinc metallopeptidase n=1 Tax=Peribacillus kribbensis TaxID=356658 RepID=UPI000423E005|nr:zinc metallopeptidase [Peribacillus kribbensis]